jgi:hypothetical protein
MQLLDNAGFEVHAIHDYERGAEQRKVLSMFCRSEASIMEVMRIGGGGGDDGEGEKESSSSSSSSSYLQAASPSVKTTANTDDDGSPTKSSQPTIRGIGYDLKTTYTGTCTYWNTSQGWGLLHSNNLPQTKKHGLFVHNTALPGGKGVKLRFLKKGEGCRFRACESGKGDSQVMACNVEGIEEGLLSCQNNTVK